MKGIEHEGGSLAGYQVYLKPKGCVTKKVMYGVYIYIYVLYHTIVRVPYVLCRLLYLYLKN